jgi:transcriptional regulator with XRE-family HTH domain
LFDIGGSLAAARKGQRLTPSDVERLTRLRGKYLAALENDDFDVLPGRVYARAFLRTYADALGLDADRFVDEFDAQYPEPEVDAHVAVIRPRRARRVSPRAILLLVVVAAVVGAAVWSVSAPPKVPPIQTPAPAVAAPKHPRAALSLPPTKPVRHAALVIRATTGPCWLLVRRGGSTGAVLFEGTLEPGQSKRFTPRVWVRLGAPGNVAIHRGPRTIGGLSASMPVNLTA